MTNKHAGRDKENKDLNDKKDNLDDGEVNEKKEKTVTIAENEYADLKSKEKEISEKILRLQADFDNSKKRLERDRIEFIKYANDQIIGELIPFVDDFQRAFSAADTTKDFNVLHKGVEMILKHLLDLLERKGVTVIEAEGKPFNPAFHEALLQVESDQYPENTVVEELQKGYLLNNRVLRTAKVKVSKSKEHGPENIVEAKSEEGEI